MPFMLVNTDLQDQEKQDAVLLDEQFLATLSEQKDRQIYARIIALDINENPIDQIEGRVSNGSVNIDGNSSVRRTCSLTLVSDKIDINDFYWSIKTKFRLFIGLENKLIGEYAYTKYGQYPQIVWFPQGTYIISAFNTTISTNNATISISGKDKMSLLNGDLGGQLFASIDFGTEETLTKTMELVTNITDTTSDTIMMHKYYYKIKVDTESPDNIIVEDNENVYVPIYNQAEGEYYKDDNIYKKESFNNNDERETVNGRKYYTIYKKVISPNELFEPYSFDGNNWKADTYFYKPYQNESEYYIRDRRTSNTNEQTYFALVPLYTLGYETTIKHIPIEKIIRESVHTYANEPYYNIVINDLEDYGLEQITYRGNVDLYALRLQETNDFTQLILSNMNDDLKNIAETINFQPDTLSNENTGTTGTPIYYYNGHYSLIEAGSNIQQKIYTMAILKYGDDIGYRLTDLTYAGDLISSIGETLTSILDKIKTMLGDFEYFYDLDGKFIFQRKPSYVNTSWSQLTETDDETYVDYANGVKKKFSFNFEGNRLISSIQNSPVINNLRNDFIVWGKRKTASGAEIPIHARYAIDKKPVYYKALNNEIYTTDIQYAYEQLNQEEENIDITASALKERIKNFTLNYPIQDDLPLTPPVRNSNNNGWTPGWWDIRDWAEYYLLLNPDAELGTMKFFSSNDANGCMMISDLLANGVQLPSIYQTSNYANRHVWLLEVYASGVINLGHGLGVYNENQTTTSTFWTSVYENGRVVSTPTNQTKQMHPPYSSCSDNHTYLYFLDLINRLNERIYFYNPQFPFEGENEENLINKQIEGNYFDYLTENRIHIVDWREIIYQMALDYFAGQGCSENEPIYTREQDGTWTICCTDPDHFLYEVGVRNPYYYPTGYTGYEQYYTDMQGFWRQLYNPEYIPEAIYETGFYTTEYTLRGREKQWNPMQLTDFNIDYYISIKDEAISQQINQYFSFGQEIQEEDPVIYFNNEQTVESQIYNTKYKKYLVSSNDILNDTDQGKRLYWNRAVFEAPETLNFWFDFLDSETELASFSVKSVGDKTKVINEDKAKAIFYKEIPGLILYDINQTKQENNNTVCDPSKLREQITEQSGYTFIFLPQGFSKYLTISYRGVSVKNKIDELLYQYAYCIENISLTAIPVYYLQPNTRIYVQDRKSEIEGEYIVSKITLSLNYNGTMSISASKAPERLY